MAVCWMRRLTEGSEVADNSTFMIIEYHGCFSATEIDSQRQSPKCQLCVGGAMNLRWTNCAPNLTMVIQPGAKRWAGNEESQQLNNTSFTIKDLTEDSYYTNNMHKFQSELKWWPFFINNRMYLAWFWASGNFQGSGQDLYGKSIPITWSELILPNIFL